jgi:hypothetical protein
MSFWNVGNHNNIGVRTQNTTIWSCTLYELNNSMESFLRSSQSLSCQKLFFFVKSEGSLLCSQEVATALYPESDESNLLVAPYFFKIHFNSIPIYVQVLQVASILQVYRQTLYALGQGYQHFRHADYIERYCIMCYEGRSIQISVP